MRRILLVGSGRAEGGTERVLADSARRLAGRGDRVHVWLAPGDGVRRLEESLRHSGAEVSRRGEIDSLGAGFREGVDALRGLDPDILHIHLPWPHANPWLPLAGRMAGVRAVVATEHLLFPEHHLRDDLRKRASGAFIDRTVAVSSGVARCLVRRWGYRESRIRVIPNGVDLAEFPGPDPAARERGRRALGVGSGDFLVASAGRLARQKGFSDLIRAAATAHREAPELRVAIAGEGELADSLAAEARDSGLGRALILPGRVARMPDFLAAADLFVLPSLWEGMPLSLLEAMAMGVPVVATRTPGSEEILAEDPAAGDLVPPGDPDAIAAAIVAARRDPAAARARGERGRARVRAAHDLVLLFERLVAVYDEIAGSRAA